MFEKLYKSIGEKIKYLAIWIALVSSAFAIIGGVALLAIGKNKFLIIAGILVLILGPIISWVSSWLLYGFGELIDKTCANEHHAKEMLAIMKNTKKKENALTKGD